MRKQNQNFVNMNFGINFAIHKTVDVVQQVRTSDCGSEGRGFESHLPPQAFSRCSLSASYKIRNPSYAKFWRKLRHFRTFITLLASR